MYCKSVFFVRHRCRNIRSFFALYVCIFVYDFLYKTIAHYLNLYHMPLKSQSFFYSFLIRFLTGAKFSKTKKYIYVCVWGGIMLLIAFLCNYFLHHSNSRMSLPPLFLFFLTNFLKKNAAEKKNGKNNEQNRKSIAPERIFRNIYKNAFAICFWFFLQCAFDLVYEQFYVYIHSLMSSNG